MPELPEVETLVVELRRVLENQKIAKVEVFNDSILETPRAILERKLPGKKIVQIGRVGKYIRIDLTGDLILWFHLGMTGQILFEESHPTLSPHTHLILSFGGSEQCLFYRDIRRFGRISLTSSMNTNDPGGIHHLGLEPSEWDKESFASQFKERRARIKNLLLNQRFIAGLGNIYADESLHRAGIHPLKRARQVSRHKLARLHESICEVLEQATHWGGSSIDDYIHLDGTKGRFQRFHRVYGRTGQNCLTCGAVIKKIRLSGRSSSFCPECQPYR